MQVERWTLLIVREALLRGVSRFPDFQISLGIAPDMLTVRLDDLVSAGVFSVTDTGDYLLTTKGHDLESTISALSVWSERWVAPTHSPSVPLMVSPISVVAADGAPAQTPEPFVGQHPETTERPGDAREISTESPVSIEISLLGTFSLRVGGRAVAPISVGSQRLLVFLALHDRAVGRAAMAGRMWPDASDERAGISLRSALSRLDVPTREAILTASAGLSLADTVIVDFRAAQALAHRLLQPTTLVRNTDLTPAALAVLSSELLPDWYDDWVVAEAEDWRQLRMNALEILATHLTESGRLADAAGAARAAMKVEPLRESAHATLIRVHLAEGNQSEALRVYDRYSALLDTALGLDPTIHLTELVSSLGIR